MLKLPLIPDNSSYAVNFGSSVVSTKLKGGASRYRQDILGSAEEVNASWICGREEYYFLAGFYKTLTKEGALPFEIELILDTDQLETYEAHFVPKSFALTAQKGLTYWVSASLEVVPKDRSSDQNYLDNLTLFLEYGPDYRNLFISDSNELRRIINIKIPSYLQ